MPCLLSFLDIRKYVAWLVPHRIKKQQYISPNIKLINLTWKKSNLPVLLKKSKRGSGTYETVSMMFGIFRNLTSVKGWHVFGAYAIQTHRCAWVKRPFIIDTKRTSRENASEVENLHFITPFTSNHERFVSNTMLCKVYTTSDIQVQI